MHSSTCAANARTIRWNTHVVILEILTNRALRAQEKSLRQAQIRGRFWYDREDVNENGRRECSMSVVQRKLRRADVRGVWPEEPEVDGWPAIIESDELYKARRVLGYEVYWENGRERILY